MLKLTDIDLDNVYFQRLLPTRQATEMGKKFPEVITIIQQDLVNLHLATSSFGPREGPVLRQHLSVDSIPQRWNS